MVKFAKKVIRSIEIVKHVKLALRREWVLSYKSLFLKKKRFSFILKEYIFKNNEEKENLYINRESVEIAYCKGSYKRSIL